MYMTSCPNCEGNVKLYCIFAHCSHCESELVCTEYSTLNIEDCYNCKFCQPLMALENCCIFEPCDDMQLDAID